MKERFIYIVRGVLAVCFTELNIAMNGDFCDEKNGKIKTSKIISVSNFRAPEYFKVKAVYM